MMKDRILPQRVRSATRSALRRQYDNRMSFQSDVLRLLESSRVSGETVTYPLAGEMAHGSGEVLQVRSPFDDSPIGALVQCEPEDVIRAVSSARRALTRGLPAWQRAEVLDKAAAHLSEMKEVFARVVCDEAAKPIRTARIEVERAISTFQFSAAQARTLTGEMIPMSASSSGEGRLGFTIRVPIGVVGAISPFNFPLNLVVHKVGPAIAAGCPIVLKPASQTPLTSVLLARMLVEDCGLPVDWIHVVPGPGSRIGDAIVDHQDVSLVTFTGSPEVGWGIRQRAPKKRVGLELGNNAPVIIEPDGDWRLAASKIKTAGFSHAGQSCISTQRILVHSDVSDAFIHALLEEVDSIVVGDPRSEATEVSSLISAKEKQRVLSWIEEALDQGARVLCGGYENSDGVLMPTVLTDVQSHMKVCRAEVFGPVIVISRYDSLKEALEMANDSDFGLQAGIFTSRIDRALEAIETLDFGGVVVNDVPTYRADQQPYGGLRDSGNTREGPAYSIREMTEIKMVVINP